MRVSDLESFVADLIPAASKPSSLGANAQVTVKAPSNSKDEQPQKKRGRGMAMVGQQPRWKLAQLRGIRIGGRVAGGEKVAVQIRAHMAARLVLEHAAHVEKSASELNELEVICKS